MNTENKTPEEQEDDSDAHAWVSDPLTQRAAVAAGKRLVTSLNHLTAAASKSTDCVVARAHEQYEAARALVRLLTTGSTR